MKAIIVGGGISGLATAYELVAGGFRDLELVEAQEGLGGLIASRREDGFLLESGPDAFIAQKPHALDLCRRLGLEGRLVSTPQQHRRSHLWSDGRFWPLPTGFLNPPIFPDEIEGLSFLSSPARQRAAQEPQVAPSTGVEESVADFFERRFGSEVVEKIIAPLTAGVFGGAAHRISLSQAFPRVMECEQRNGCLTARSHDASLAAGRRTTFLAPDDGMQVLIDSLRDRIRDRVRLRLATPVRRLAATSQGCEVVLEDGDRLSAEAVVLAVTAPAAARLVEKDWPALARTLSVVEYEPALTVCLGYASAPTIPAGTGFLVSGSAGSPLLACTWAHQKFPQRCPGQGGLLRAFIAGEAAGALLTKDDTFVVDLVTRELSEMMKIDPQPRIAKVFRFSWGLPLYELGHGERTARLVSLVDQISGLQCVGNFLDGIGISDCIRHASVAAQRIRETLEK